MTMVRLRRAARSAFAVVAASVAGSAAAGTAILAGAAWVVAPDIAFAATSGGGVTALQSGYWWAGQPDGAPLPPPPQVPPGGLWISSNASGPQAVAAVRFTLAPGVSAPVLVLSVHQAQPANQVAIVACPTESKWTAPGTAGAWSARPASDCAAGAVNGELSADGKSLQFNLYEVAPSPMVDVVLIPATVGSPASAVPGTPSSGHPTFDATFEPVGSGDVHVTGTPQQSSTPAPSVTTAPASPSAGDGSSMSVAPSSPVLTPALPLGTGQLSALAAPSTGRATVQPTTGTTSATASVPQAFASGRGVGTGQAAAAVSPYHKALSARDRWILLWVLVDLGVLAWVEGSGRGRARSRRPRLSLQDVPAAGIASSSLAIPAAGRTERIGSPPALR